MKESDPVRRQAEEATENVVLRVVRTALRLNPPVVLFEQRRSAGV